MSLCTQPSKCSTMDLTSSPTLLILFEKSATSWLMAVQLLSAFTCSSLCSVLGFWGPPVLLPLRVCFFLPVYIIVVCVILSSLSLVSQCLLPQSPVLMPHSPLLFGTFCFCDCFRCIGVFAKQDFDRKIPALCE